jgi:hypothetical protein
MGVTEGVTKGVTKIFIVDKNRMSGCKQGVANGRYIESTKFEGE